VGAEDHGVKPLDFQLLSDENIAPDVVTCLRARGCDFRPAYEEGPIGRLAFGRAAIRSDIPFVGIVYLRPGHISADFVLGVIDALRASAIDVQPPFVVVAERRGATIRVSVRTEPPW
jgi:hypothetical protein